MDLGNASRDGGSLAAVLGPLLLLFTTACPSNEQARGPERGTISAPGGPQLREPANPTQDSSFDPTPFVDPFVGTAAHGHTYPGPTMPFGMVQVGPDTGTQGWDWCAGYHYSDTSIIGFSHTHLSGTGVGDLGDLLFMPGVGRFSLEQGTKEKPDSGYRSRFSHAREAASPGYYRVELEDYDIKVELTASERVALHKYVFPRSEEAWVLVDLVRLIHGEPTSVRYAQLRVESDTLVTGHRTTRQWAKNRHLYFAVKFSKAFAGHALFAGKTPHEGRPELSSDQLRAAFRFKTRQDEALLVKVALSPVSTANALRNLDAEILDWDFERVKVRARKKWATELQRVRVSGTASFRRTFYTAMYHTMLAPTLHMDANGQYRGLDQNVHQARGFSNYTTFSLWDTFRALHPLFTILQPHRTSDWVHSMLAHFRQSAYGMLPVWPLHHNETWCMIGYHSAPVIVDAYLKGLTDVAPEELLAALTQTAQHADYDGLKHYMEGGYVPADKEREGTSKTLEYAYDDWCIAQMARKLGRKDEYERFRQRSQNFRHVYDAKTGFMRARLSDGTWREPFDPRASHRKHPKDRDYTEGNAWQWLWFVPHDVQALIGLVGGREAFLAKLDALLGSRPGKRRRDLPDITGLIGEYAHGNEPSHHIPYLYVFAGAPWKTQALVRRIMNEFYSDRPDGIAGNEDCGQMSAWYIFSALGFYPVNPVSGIYILGSPLVSKAAIALDGDKTFTVIAENQGADNVYVQSIQLNGQPHDRAWITHDEVVRGGELKFVLGSEPKKDWGVSDLNVPGSHGE